MHRLWIQAVGVTLALTFAAHAQVYGVDDARYVTSSRNPAVLRYVVCLEAAVGMMPRSMSLGDAMRRAENECANAAARLPRSAGEPDAADLHGMIMECGFRPGEGSPDAGCDGADNAGAGSGPMAPDDVALAPRVIELGKWLEGITYDGAWLWVSESGQRTIAKVDLRTGRLAERYKVGRLPIAVATTGDDDIFTLVATDKVILRHDSGGRKSTLAKLGECPDGMVPWGTDLFVLTEPDCSSASSRLVRIDSTTGRSAKSADLGEWAQSLAAIGSEIWVGHARYTAISIVDQSSLGVSKLAVPGLEAWAMAANSASVFAGGRYENTDHDGSIVMIDAGSRKEVARYSVTELVSSMAADDTHVVVIGDKGTIWLFSARDLTLLRTIHLSAGEYRPRGAIFANGALVISASQYRGENGAVFVLEDYLPKMGRNVGNNNRPAGPNRPVARPTGPNRPIVRPTGPTAPVARPTSPNRPIVRPTGPNRPTARPTGPTRPTVSARGFPVPAGSWAGKVRSGPGLNYSQVGSTTEGQAIELLENTGEMFNGYPWFKISYDNGNIGYQWGGIICSVGNPVPGTEGFCLPGSEADRAAQNAGNQGPNRPFAGRPGNSNRPIINNPGVGNANGNRNAALNPQAVVGTYSSNTGGTSGNLELSSAGLTWTEFCGPTYNLSLDRANSRLLINTNPRGEFTVTSRNGAVTGFIYGAQTYTKLAGIMMPGCAPDPNSANANGQNQNPGVDPRINNDYSMMPDGTPTPNGLFFTCAQDHGENSPAYFDCLDQARMNALEELDDQADAANTNAMAGQHNGTADPNADPAYSWLPEDVLQTCNRDVSCLDAAVSQASRANAQATDPRANDDYGALAMGVLTTCANDHGEGSPPYYDCLDVAMNALTAGDVRAGWDWSDLDDQEKLGCETYGSGTASYYDCLENVRAQKSAQNNNASAADAGVQEPGADRATVFYQPAYDYCVGQLNLAEGTDEYSTCYFAYGN